MPSITTKKWDIYPVQCLSSEVFNSQCFGLPENKTVMVKDVVMW